MTHIVKLVLIAATSFGLAGCGSGVSDMPDRYPVKGIVLLDGKPLPTGEILFTSFDNDGSRPDAGQINEDGTFEFLVTPGKKRIEITAVKEIPAKSPQGMPDVQVLVPSRYNEQSELMETVEPNQDNDYSIMLESK